MSGALGQKQSQKPPGRALIVDDEPDMLDYVERVLRGRYTVERAGSGDEALACLEAAPGDVPFDVIITDHWMPRMTGSELLEAIQGRWPTMARVLLSGFGDVPEVQRLARIGAIGAWAAKPADSETLLGAVSSALERARSTSV